MSPQDKQQLEAMWRNRFIIINLVRIGATLLVLLGLAIWYSDWFREGGLPEVGIPLTLIALVASFAAPQWLARTWRTPPE